MFEQIFKSMVCYEKFEMYFQESCFSPRMHHGQWFQCMLLVVKFWSSHLIIHIVPSFQIAFN